MNLALYRPDGDRWVMTEHAAADRTASHLRIGATEIAWTGDALTLSFDERTVPWGGRLTGRVRLVPLAPGGEPLGLDAGGAHQWWPVAPVAHAEVELTTPRLRFTGAAYHDANFGARPLERDFRRWHWSRAACADGTVVLYDVEPAEGAAPRRGLHFGRDGGVRALDPPVTEALPGTRWGLRRAVRTEPGAPVELVRTLEDTPFYARSWLLSRWGGQPAQTMHESLDLQRFSRGWVRFLLPFRIRRSRA